MRWRREVGECSAVRVVIYKRCFIMHRGLEMWRITASPRSGYAALLQEPPACRDAWLDKFDVPASSLVALGARGNRGANGGDEVRDRLRGITGCSCSTCTRRRFSRGSRDLSQDAQGMSQPRSCCARRKPITLRPRKRDAII